MPVIFRMLGMDLRRAVISWRFALVTLISVLVMMQMPFVVNAFCLVSMCDMMLTGTTVFTIVTIVLPAIPYAHAYLSDYRSNAVRYWSARGGVTSYGASKFIAAVLSGMLTYIVSMATVILIKSASVPLWSGDVSSTIGYMPLLLNEDIEQSRPMMYIVLTVLHHSLTAGMFASAAFCAVTIIPNMYVGIMTPVLLDFAYMRLSSIMHVPEHLNEIAMVQDVYNMGSISMTILNKLAFTLCALLLFGGLAIFMIRWRLKHD